MKKVLVIALVLILALALSVAVYGRYIVRVRPVAASVLLVPAQSYPDEEDPTVDSGKPGTTGSTGPTADYGDPEESGDPEDPGPGDPDGCTTVVKGYYPSAY